MVPKAIIAHHTSSRLRIRVCARRADRGYFKRLKDHFSKAFPSLFVTVNSATASLLMTGEPIGLQEIADSASKEKLFTLDASKPQDSPMALSITEPLHTTSHQIRQVSGGRLDLPGAVFLALMVSGIIEIIRGNWRTPPWYTAFWYAFGLYSKSLIEQTADKGIVDSSKD
jgi:hypothetical protein